MWHEQVPREVEANLRFRRRLLGICSQSRAAQQAMIEACRQDILFYVNAFCWTYDPRTIHKSIPFVTWPYQEKAFLAILECVKEGRDLVIEKSRDMGASWICLTAQEYLWHFHPGYSFLMVSRKEDLVDAPGDPDSLFWKIDFLHRYQPSWLLPPIERKKLHFGNPQQNSSIDGESTTSAAGVGGRRSAMFIDEFSRIEEGYQLLAGTADTTRCRIFNFTPWGTSNAAYKLARRGDIKKLRMHWSEHPHKAAGLYRYDEKTHKIIVLDKTYHYAPDFRFVMDGRLRSPWYDSECERRANDREVAQMLDIDYQGSAYQFFDRSLILVLQANYCTPPLWEGDIIYDRDTGKPQGLIPSPGGPVKLWCQPDVHNRPPKSRYAGGADISTGAGSTNSCISFFDCRTGEKVLEYATPFMKPEPFAVLAVALCKTFVDENDEPCFFGWEHCGPGVMFGKKIIDLDYWNIYWREKNIVVKGEKLSGTPGWFPSNENKLVLLEEYRSGLMTRQCLNRSHGALEECLEFVHTQRGTVEHAQEEGGNDPTGARANHGDRVIADAIGWKLALSFGMIGRKKDAKGDQGIPVGSLAWRRELARKEEEDVL